ncbi:hypothetical protein ONS96_007219 [Cadophora gregata f. sp. sojae]|nr:hypothetical protein ONS96_007219 [Cadophora gregata f. sp. sojae]
MSVVSTKRPRPKHRHKNLDFETQTDKSHPHPSSVHPRSSKTFSFGVLPPPNRRSAPKKAPRPATDYSLAVDGQGDSSEGSSADQEQSDFPGRAPSNSTAGTYTVSGSSGYPAVNEGMRDGMGTNYSLGTGRQGAYAQALGGNSIQYDQRESSSYAAAFNDLGAAYSPPISQGMNIAMAPGATRGTQVPQVTTSFIPSPVDASSPHDSAAMSSNREVRSSSDLLPAEKARIDSSCVSLVTPAAATKSNSRVARMKFVPSIIELRQNYRPPLRCNTYHGQEGRTNQVVERERDLGGEIMNTMGRLRAMNEEFQKDQIEAEKSAHFIRAKATRCEGRVPPSQVDAGYAAQDEDSGSEYDPES